MATDGVDPRIAAASAGDRQAAEALLRHYLPRIRNLARYLLDSSSDVDDVTQDAMVSILRCLPSYRGEGAFRAWVDRIVARTVFRYIERRRRTPSLVSVQDAAPELTQGADQDRGIAHRRLAALLGRIPSDQRYVLVMHHAMGLTVPEIAEELGVPFETVRSRLRLGKSRLWRLVGRGPKEAHG